MRKLSFCLMFVSAVAFGPAEVNGQSVRPEDVAAKFEKLQQSLEYRRGSLVEVQGRMSVDMCANVTGYTASSVTEAYADIRTEVLAPLAAPEAAPLRELLVQRFPAAPTGQSNCFGASAVEVIDEKSATEYATKIDFFLGAATELAKPMTVIVSSPKQPRSWANLRPSAGGPAPAPRWTVGTFPDLFRGPYNLTVEKDGFKPFDDRLGELKADTVNIECELAALSSTGKSRCAVSQ